MAIFSLVRWIHVLSASAWFGEVIVINFVLVPLLVKMEKKDQSKLLVNLFPRIFMLASVLSLTAILSGITLVLLMIDWRWHLMWTTGWGLTIMIGGGLGLALTTFHFTLERKMEGFMDEVKNDPGGPMTDRMVKLLRIIPRAGLAVIGSILLLMMYAAHGFY